MLHRKRADRDESFMSIRPIEGASGWSASAWDFLQDFAQTLPHFGPQKNRMTGSIEM
jgi:hypothetical protein